MNTPRPLDTQSLVQTDMGLADDGDVRVAGAAILVTKRNLSIL
jgi:hypothetical protein